jgi:m7GpppX diphosphatase
MENDIYEKYEATAEISGELIICNDVTKMKHTEKKLVRETYEEYLISLQKRDPNKDKWIYNIVDGSSEQEQILYRDESCIVIPTYMWDSVNIDKLHILCLPTDVTLRSIRSLTAEHIELLEHMKKVTLETIKNKYGLDECYLKMFFHYEPSTYHLHIHFVNTAYHESRSSVEYSHELNNVIFNLSLYSQYYKVAILNRRG